MSQPANKRTGPGSDGTKTRRYILGSIAFLFLALVATQVFLHQTSVGSPKFVRMTFLLWTATFLVVLALLILATVLGRNLIKLYFERKSGQVGSRFRTKVVSIFVALSLLPALVVFFLARGLVSFSIEQWFSAPAEQMLGYSTAIAEQYYEETHRRAEFYAARIAQAVNADRDLRVEVRSGLEERLSALRREYLLDDVRIFNRRGRLAAESGSRISLEQHAAEVKRLVDRALAGEVGFKVERFTPSDALKEIVWATAPIRAANGEILAAVLTEMMIPQSVYFKAHSVMEAFSAYQQLQNEKAKLRFNFLLILALSTLLIVFGFSWFAMYLAKRITVPIQALAEGAAAVASGNLDYRVVCSAFDELESLVISFNRMTGDLQENKSRIEAAQDSLRRSNVELDDRRRYIETILQTIQTGVISLDANLRIRTMNRAASEMLDVRDFPANVPLEQVVHGSAGKTLALLLRKSTVLGPVVRDIELSLPSRMLHLATTVTPLLDGAGKATAGWVVVLDDITELLRMEKLSAWQEVARRLAHEIKNPLTPIQLSAERLAKRYKQLLPAGGREKPEPGGRQEAFDSFGSLLEECVGTITQEADCLKNLVVEFSRFARLPQVCLKEEDIHRVLETTLALYDGRLQDVELRRDFSPDLPMARVDAEQIKRVLINLFDNALEAMMENPRPKALKVATSFNHLQRSVRIEISDTGKGFPEEYQDSLFLPYFSTRKGGTGLGLAIVRQIISDHHGYVRAEANVPFGTRIIIDLPSELSGE